jgi:hypothetical protein
MTKVILKGRNDVVSPKNRLVGSYIYGSRGISPRNILIESDFYTDEITQNEVISIHVKIKKIFLKILKKTEDTN